MSKNTEKIRISLNAFDSDLIQQTSRSIIEIAKSVEDKTNIRGPIFLPTQKRIYCVLRSPHVDKDSREQFEIRRYKCIIDIYPTSLATTDTLLKIEVPCGISADVRLNRKPKRNKKQRQTALVH